MRPENDGLLFAYFGVSLAIRRRSQRSDLRAKLAIKRKAHRLLGDKSHMSLLLRSPDAIGYPSTSSLPDFDENPPWVVRKFTGIIHAGLKFQVGRFFAFLSDDGTEWDAALAYNDALPSRFESPWGADEDHQSGQRQKLFEFWNNLPEQNRAWFDVEGIVPFEEVLDIDEYGDEFVNAPHVYVPFEPEDGPFRGFYEALAVVPVRGERREVDLSAEGVTRIEVFPSELRSRR